MDAKRARKTILLNLFVVGVCLSSCMALKSPDGSSEDAIVEFQEETTRQDAYSGLETQKVELSKNVVLQELEQRLEEEKQKIKEEQEVEEGVEERELAEEQVEEVEPAQEPEPIAKMEPTLIEEEIEEEKSASLQIEETKIASLRIKILSGDGDMGSARAMSKRLKEMGYTVERVDLASRSDFPRDTIFYKTSFREEAEVLTGRIGKGATTKPLSWMSQFDIIVATGKSKTALKTASLKIKVLSGDGNIGSAKAMSKRLSGMGYSVERVDLAQSAGFTNHTVFYKEAFQDDAKRLAERIGSGTSRKPLTWASQFNIIVVSGNQP